MLKYGLRFKRLNLDECNKKIVTFYDKLEWSYMSTTYKSVTKSP
jgi:hypothetical protein